MTLNLKKGDKIHADKGGSLLLTGVVIEPEHVFMDEVLVLIKTRSGGWPHYDLVKPEEITMVNGEEV